MVRQARCSRPGRLHLKPDSCSRAACETKLSRLAAITQVERPDRVRRLVRPVVEALVHAPVRLQAVSVERLLDREAAALERGVGEAHGAEAELGPLGLAEQLDVDLG